MEKKVLLRSCAVGFFGLLSAVAGFGAEATRIKGSQVEFVSTTQCVYPRSPAMAFGLTAAFALMVAQIIINVSTGCICCKRNTQPHNSNRNLALMCFVISWITFVIAFILLLVGAALNDQHSLDSINSGNYHCYVVKPGVFAGGAILSLASVTLGILCYLTFTSAKNSSTTWGGSAPNQGGIVMGQPQFPPQNT
ncbi:hypothetical protein UlMin_024738 [Ulmus minor]